MWCRGNTVVALLCLGLALALTSGAGAAELLADDTCPDMERERHAETLRVGLLRISSMGACYDVYVPAGSLGVARLKDTSGETKSAVSVRRYADGRAQQDQGGAQQRVIFGEVSESGWYQVRIDHYGYTGAAALHLYQVDVAAAIMRGMVTGFGQVLAEEAFHWLTCQLIPCEATQDGQLRQAMLSRGVTLAVSALQQRSLGDMTRDMALNEAGILVRQQFGSAGGHTLTVVMAVVTEVIDSIYAD
jgi:hypothetical protein